jgi:hypothetical protein
VAFFRFSRDKRGYEHFYLMQPSNRGKIRPRLLYWFRTPPNIKVGRGPFEPEIRRAIESQFPDIVFDWKAIAAAPIPPADAERWRERRRQERASRAAEPPPEAAPEAESQAAEPTEAELAPEVTAADASVTSNERAAVESGPAERPTGTRKRRRRRGRRRSGGDRLAGDLQDPGVPPDPAEKNGETEP